MEFPDGWERWRGETDARLDVTETSIAELWKWCRTHEHDVSRMKSDILQRLAVVETKVAVYAATGAALGVFAAVLFEWLLGRTP